MPGVYSPRGPQRTQGPNHRLSARDGKGVLFVGAASLVLSCAPAHAQTASQAAAATSSARATVEDVIVRAPPKKAAGGGLIKPEAASKTVSTISSAYIQSQPSIQNAYQYVQLAPGALVSTTDPYGLSEQGSINVHGLGQDELGYVLEGMPLNDIGYYAGYPSQFVDSENIDEVSLAQGTADLDSPVISAAGGLMTLTMLDPAMHPGGDMDVAYGSYTTDREFLRLDTGLIGGAGWRAFASYSHTGSDDWRGPGRVIRQHADFKAVKEWGDNRIALAATWHNGVTPAYVEPTLGDFQQNGISHNYDAGYTPGDANYYKLYVGTFRILYISAPSRLRLNDKLVLNITPYWQYGYGNSPFGTTLGETGNFEGTAGPYTLAIPGAAGGSGAVMANYLDLQHRAGVVAKLTYSTGPNDLIVGYWADYADEEDTQSFSGLSPSGEPANLWGDAGAGLIRLPNGQPFLAGHDHVITKVNEPFVADVLHLMGGRLTLEAGLKQAFVDRGGTNDLPGPQYAIDIKNSETLPRLAARLQITPESQVFASVSTNFRTPSEATLFDGYSGGMVSAVANANLKPEYSVAEDIGYRYTGARLTASVSVFNYNFSNRQVATLIDAGTVNESVNAGRQTAHGVDLEAGLRPWRHFSPYVAGEWLHSIDDSNLPYNGGFLPTAGKTSVRSPKFQAALGLNYDDGRLFGDIDVKYVDAQYSTFMDDEAIPSYATVNLALGYRLPQAGALRPEIKVNIVNLTGLNYLASVANPTPSAAIASPPPSAVITAPTYYLSGGRAAMVTLATAF
ncbi:MAG: TonB-dependent receptor [Caulobacteraceae bacterium]|nr:TonB-dependent receptor [Caulobacteraceae bacterium]